MNPFLLVLHSILVLVVPLALAEIEMEFTKSPESVTAPVGDEVTFVCAVKVPGERLVWRTRPLALPDAQWTEVQALSDNEHVSTKLVVEISDVTPSALYQCVVWYGGISLASIPAQLTIAKLNLSRNSAEKRVITPPLYNTVVLHCKEPASEPPAVLSWWKETGQGSRKQIDTPHGVLVIKNATRDDSGTYGCTATNELSGQTIELPERTYLKVQHEGSGGIRFLESEDYVGTITNDDVLTVGVRPGEALRLWCGVVGVPPPRVTWAREGGPPLPRRHDHALTVDPFTSADEGIYSCTAGGVRRAWLVSALEPARWVGGAASVNASEGSPAQVACGRPAGSPPPSVHWMLNAEPLKGKGVRTTASEVTIDRTEKRHAGIVQCFACNALGCAYDAALLTIVPTQISDQEYSEEISRSPHYPLQPPKRHNRKTTKKHKVVMIPPSRPNVTRMSDESVMVSWTWANAKHGLPVQFFKVQYREATNSSNVQWYTVSQEIPPYIQSFEISGLTPDKSYKFRIAAVYSNQDNKQGRSSNKFLLKRGGFQTPKTPILVKVEGISPNSIQLNWTLPSGGDKPAEGFYVYYRAVSSAGEYTKVTVGGENWRGIVLTHLNSDTSYECKVQSYTAQAPSDFSAILTAKTHKSLEDASGTTTEAPAADLKDGQAPSALVTAGGALAGGALLVLVLTVLLCRRAKQTHNDKEKGSVPESAANGYIPAKVPITITANPMHAESGDGSVEMSFLHNNNCGNAGSNDDTLPHSRKNGPNNRQYV